MKPKEVEQMSHIYECFLPQTLKVEPYHDSFLARYLIQRALRVSPSCSATNDKTYYRYRHTTDYCSTFLQCTSYLELHTVYFLAGTCPCFVPNPYSNPFVFFRSTGLIVVLCDHRAKELVTSSSGTCAARCPVVHTSASVWQ